MQYERLQKYRLAIDATMKLKNLAAPPLCEMSKDSLEPGKNRRVDATATVFGDENERQVEAENAMIQRFHLLFCWHNEGTL
jgi:hypothetical protein